jgi:acyl transferase domain-containing protein/acyl carrier protein
MSERPNIAIAVVGISAILPDAPNAGAFWDNLVHGRYSISEVDSKRWDPAEYYDADRTVPDKTYSKIGGWVREWEWNPIGWHLPVPPRVADVMDDIQKWSVSLAHAALSDYGWPARHLDLERTGVILGNALAGENQWVTAQRVTYPDYEHDLARTTTFAGLPTATRAAILGEARVAVAASHAPITEDTMPGELANVIAGRVANLFDLRGPNYVCDAACASALAAMNAAVGELIEGRCDSVLTGGIDRTMNATAYVKFSKIGALSATGTRPYAEGADGFVMGEGGAMFLLKRLSDAERDGDRIYAVVRGLGGSSDGKGKGITAPNPVGQKLAVQRAWQTAGLSPATATMIEGHGTSTRVGDTVEGESLAEVLRAAGATTGSVALGSVKSNIGHLKAAAGAAGLLKTVLALDHKVIPPSLHCERPNPSLDFEHSPLRVVTSLEAWAPPAGGVRRAGVSAFGFGGTNFHAVLEEHIPGRLDGKRSFAIGQVEAAPPSTDAKPPLRGAAVIGAATAAGLTARLDSLAREARAGRTPKTEAPARADLHAAERIAIDFGGPEDLAQKVELARRALETEPAASARPMWKALRARGIFRGTGPAPKVAFLFSGQGSQYVNMLAGLRRTEPIVASTFAEADTIMAPLLGRKLSEILFVEPGDAGAVARSEAALRETEITQPAVMTVDLALARLLEAYGIKPDMVMGHSLGEYGALMAAGCLTFEHTLEAVSARGREMSDLSIDDRGVMAAVMAPLVEIEKAVAAAGPGVVIANVNSTAQGVIGGPTIPVRRAMESLAAAGHQVVELPVSHAFHTSIVAPASAPLRQALVRLDLRAPQMPIVANVTGRFYPTGAQALSEMLDLLGRQVAEPVQFVEGLRTLYDAGARVFVEVGPKRALQGFSEDVLGAHEDAVSLFTNHPKTGELESFNQALCGLYASGLGTPRDEAIPEPVAIAAPDPVSPRVHEPVVITGAALGLPGTEHVFDDRNLGRMLAGDNFIDVVPTRFRRAMLDKHITRLVKREDGDPTFEVIDDPDAVIRLAGRAGILDLTAEFGVPADLVAALDRTTMLAIGAGIDALRDAGIPLTMHYRTTSVGSRLPERWSLPDVMRDDTGVVFASAMPGLDALASTITEYERERARQQQLLLLKDLRARFPSSDGAGVVELERRISELEAAIEEEPYSFDRRFLFHVLSMGHSQFAQLIGARGPNTQINAACASTTQAISLAQDWIHAGRCRRVVIVAGDEATSDALLEWVGSGFLASGAAATDDVVENAAIPFDRRRHGMIVGMGAAALVVESAEAARERGIAPICEVLGTVAANSAYHGTRLDPKHISQVMESLVKKAEQDHGISRDDMAAKTVFISHETYTPARGGSAAAEVDALRAVFGEHASKVVIANTKGFTGHPMGVGLEDVVAVKALETGVVPPVPNFKEQDPDLGPLNLSRGGAYAPTYALRLAAGFGSQISMALLRWVEPPDGLRRPPDHLGYGHRIADRIRWKAWLQQAAGRPDPELEVVQRTLRVHDSTTSPAPKPAMREPGPARATAPAAPVSTAVVPAAPTAKPAPMPPPAPPVLNGADPVAERVLALVAQKTGYPADMLGLDLDLEADLGVDTVKQAELFASLRETYGFARDERVQLRDFPTLAHVIRFVHERVDGAGMSATPEVAPSPAKRTGSPPPSSPDGDDPVAERVVAMVAEKTGYPADMLGLDLDLEADLGVDTVKQAELFASLRETYGFARDDRVQLRDFPTLAHVIRFVRERTGTPAAAPATAPPAPPPAATPLGAPAPRSPGGDDPVAERVVAMVAEKTGYPADMLGLDLDLEADLGVDTVKQAELFASLRETYGFARDDHVQLRDFPTLAHVIRFMRERVDGVGAGAATTIAVASPPPSSIKPAVAAPDLSAADVFPRRVPVPVLRPSIDLCGATGVRLEAGARVAVFAGEGPVAACLTKRLEAGGVDVLRIEGFPGAGEMIQKLESWTSAGAVRGIYWLPALDVEPALPDLEFSTWKEGLRRRVTLLHAAVRALGEHLGGGGTFLVAATALGGRHGYGERPASAPMGGAVAGFTKAFHRERPDCLVKVVDFEPASDPDRVSEQLVAETLFDPATVEVGRSGDERWSVGLEERPASGPGMTLGADSVFVVTGAAGSIVSAIVADLAAATSGTFHLLDLTPAPDPADPDIARFADDREGLKSELAERLRAAGERPTPAFVEKRLAAIERSHAALVAIRSVQSAGGHCFYHPVDITDPMAVSAIVDDVRRRHGRIDVLLHAAGIEISHLLPDKDAAEFDRVFGVKAHGWFNLLRSAGEMPIGAAIAFSSVAGRFGNAGQSDYSAANDLLCKCVSNLRALRPATHAIAIDWTAWAGIGMATRGSIPRLMELAGIEMLPPAAGIATIRRELATGAASGELLVAGKLGSLLDVPDSTWRLDPSPAATRQRAPLVGRSISMDGRGDLTAECVLDQKQQPFLDDHRIDGVPVLPGVMGIELLTELAGLPLPGRRVLAVEDVVFDSPFKFYRDEPRTLTLAARFDEEGDDIVASCRLVGSRVLAGLAEPQVTTHFSARVRLGSAPDVSAATAVTAEAIIEPASRVLAAADIRKVYFHGPSFQVLEAAWTDGRRVIGRFAAEIPDAHVPADCPLLTNPRLIELCFQTAGVLELGTSGRLALPARVGRVNVVRDPRGSRSPFFAIVTPLPADQGFDADVVDSEGCVLVEVRGYQTTAVPLAIDERLLVPFRAAIGTSS